MKYLICGSLQSAFVFLVGVQMTVHMAVRFDLDLNWSIRPFGFSISGHSSDCWPFDNFCRLSASLNLIFDFCLHNESKLTVPLLPHSCAFSSSHLLVM